MAIGFSYEDYINFLKAMKEFVTKEFYNPPGIKDVNKRIDEIIKLLQRSKGYEAIVRDVEESIELMGVVGKYTFEDIKQKYFPSSIKKTITIEIEATNENVIKWAEHEIKDLENNVWNHILKVNITTKGGNQ